MSMNKQQRLRNTAEGFMAGLAALGVERWEWGLTSWEGDFLRVWKDWHPKDRNPEYFRVFEVGGHRTTSRPRELLFSINGGSPFDGYDDELNQAPHHCTPEEFIEDQVDGASPAEWIELAAGFLRETARWGR